MELGNMKGGGWYEADDVKIGDMWTGWYPFFDEILVPFISTLSGMVHAQPFNANLRCQRWQEGCVGKQRQFSRCPATFVEKEGWKRSFVRRDIGNCIREFVKA